MRTQMGFEERPSGTRIDVANNKLNLGEAISTGFNKALDSQHPLAVSNVARLRRVHPDKSPDDLITYLNKVYIGAVATTGAGAGAAAVVPNVVVQVPVALADLLTFLEASVLYALSVAEIHGVNPEDTERRRFLVMAVLAGNSAATATIEALIGRTAPYWGKKIVTAIPMSAISAANSVLGPRFITKWGTKTGVLVLGKQVPYFIGVGIGATGNSAFGWFIIKAARKLLGPAPREWPSAVAQ